MTSIEMTKTATITTTEKDDEFSIPLCLDDIISVCKRFSNLGWRIQSQIDNILEAGVDEAIRSGSVKREALPHIKHFLREIISNPYFGEAGDQAQECLGLIGLYEDTNKRKDIEQYN